ncbi:MAG TPA: hypothetical protein VHE83_13585, partial [Mycobacteriales bacterium]|nr:hypothetical protein [Mycobacteriales bacterium]
EAAAAAGRRTTLVDADLRRPARGNAPGLAGLLRAQNRLSTDMVRMAAGATNVNNLSELRSGPDPAMALDLLRGPALPPILAALHLDSELVLIDGPSLDSPEVRAVAEAAGDVVVVVTSLSKPDEVEAGIAILRASGANVVGLIELAAHRRLIPTTLTRPNRAGAISAAAPEDAPAPTPTPTPAPGAPRTERTSDRIEPVRDPEPADEPAGPSTPQVSLLPAPPESRPPAFTAGTPDEPASWQPAANGWVPHVDETGDPRPSVTSADRDTD